jgi:hypothetical protein
MQILYETEKLKLESEYEYVALVDKLSGKILLKDEFYGDPKCGLIDKNNEWAIVAGEHLTIWTTLKSSIIESKDLQWIHSLRVKNQETVEVLTDPWSDISAIWELNLRTFEVKKVRDFDIYRGKEYSEEVTW